MWLTHGYMSFTMILYILIRQTFFLIAQQFVSLMAGWSCESRRHSSTTCCSGGRSGLGEGLDRSQWHGEGYCQYSSANIEYSCKSLIFFVFALHCSPFGRWKLKPTVQIINIVVDCWYSCSSGIKQSNHWTLQLCADLVFGSAVHTFTVVCEWWTCSLVSSS